MIPTGVPSLEGVDRTATSRARPPECSVNPRRGSRLAARPSPRWGAGQADRADFVSSRPPSLRHGASQRSRNASPGLNTVARSSANRVGLDGRSSSTVPRASSCASVGHQK